jgi:predicted house-cleaning noncanonical NTP pyrophosphatase (MazG superfamily)
MRSIFFFKEINMQDYHKLVRDNVPDRILAKGEECFFHTATEEEYRTKLREKFLEEWQEYLVSGSSDELADILEVVEALGLLAGNSFENLLEKKQKKKEERGSFKKKIILERS